MQEAYVGNGKIVNSEFLNNLTVDEAKKKVIIKLKKKKLEKNKLYLD